MKRWLLITVICTTVAAFIWGINFPYPHDPAFEISGVELIQQPDQITCGPTSALMLLRRYGYDLTLDEVAIEMQTEWIRYDKPIGLTSPDTIAPALGHFGFDARVLRGNLDRLRYFVCQKRPPMVLLRSGDLIWHWVLVIGYDEENIIVADPGYGLRRAVPNNDFQSAWDFTTDISGHDTPLYPNTLLQAAEVYPNTMVVPRLSIDEKEANMFYILIWVIFGLIVGCLAKWLHPGEDPIGFLPTVGIGIAGSFVGGGIQWLLNMGGPFSPAGFVWSIIGGVLFCFAYRRFKLGQFVQAQGRMPKSKKD